ncbi:MAG TPA: ABC transporter ATP-binding protein [Bacteroides graminisolvens]|jgi:ATP-binding cassette subfamily B protein/subfamily B ATP-binding cassette protein MsbA|uniref:ABC transporter ATP-binding protein n=1 Tax=Bacteroides graminisolvens TaxID=477666 RepID=UPI000AA2E3F0|nr:ABC transporter ATP-binding protein [Bacteroides graminisolvens]MBP6981071.1 ABC transporter ATP-binding protein [Bacteroides sp.]MCD8474847.1 ABC transporter ATP-binding protein/permease [Bacteroides graminisolvens]MCD8495645.1 ABC transporter ATP-binding protein/permease [Bacteroides graminisolvens]MCD8573096.1 ABC transporter ATP-binding protein/permease [Bacteroides graminisolvens]HPW70341.1 ABC transporter ATP-binding protein [Bacteroides graminisolvens]
MKEFIRVLRRFVPPYKKFLFLSILFNILSAILNVFSFTLIIPILQILFKMTEAHYSYIAWTDPAVGLKDIAINNFYYYITDLINQYGQSTTLLILGIFLAIMTFLKTGCYFLSSATMIPIRTGIVRDIRNKLYRKILSLPLGFFSEERKGDIIARMSGDVQEIETSIMSSLDMLFKNPILILVYFGTLIAISWKLTLFTLVVLPIMGWAMGSVGKKLKRKSLVAQGQWSDLMSQVEETLGGLRIVKAFNAEVKMDKRFTQANDDYRDTISRVNTRQQLAHPLSEFLGTILIVIVLWFGGTLILNHNSTIDAPSFIFYLVMLYSLINPLKEFSKASYAIPKGLASMERVDKILLAENTMKISEKPVPIHELKEQIEFRDVSFQYEATPVLKHINLVIPKGKTVALVGQSGSGKSTLVDLLPRFYEATEGEVLIDGINVKDSTLTDLRSIMGNVNQEAILFNDTFFNNIAFGVKGATKEQVIEAAKIANAHDFIMASEQGYDTNIGDRGGKLSGGQRQRISIARAILKNPPILILDEATSALDTESERMVQEALENLMKNRTTIAIAHRLSTIRNADEICVLHEGEIVERGKHEELFALNGYYKRLCDMQSF